MTTLRTRKVPSKELYWVIRNGRKVSSKPTSLGEAVKIMEKISASPRRSLSGGDINAVGAGFIGAGVGIIASILFNRWGQTGLDWGKKTFNESKYAQDAYGYLKTLNNKYRAQPQTRISNAINEDLKVIEDTVATVENAVQDLKQIENAVQVQSLTTSPTQVKDLFETMKKRSTEVFEGVDFLIGQIDSRNMLRLFTGMEININASDIDGFYDSFPSLKDLNTSVEADIRSRLVGISRTESAQKMVVFRKIRLVTENSTIDILVPAKTYFSKLKDRCSIQKSTSRAEAFSSSISNFATTALANIRSSVGATPTKSSPVDSETCYIDGSGLAVNVISENTNEIDGEDTDYDMIAPDSDSLRAYLSSVRTLLVNPGIGKTGKDDVLLRGIVKVLDRLN